MIQKFLINNLIEVTEDANFNKLKKVCTILEKKLQKNKQNISTLTLIALDPEIPPANPVVKEIQQLIVSQWKTFTVNSKDTAITFIRAVILEVLSNLSRDFYIANQIWLSGRNIQKYFKLIGKEKELITNFLLSLGKEIETKATESWSLPSDSKFQKLIIELKELTGVNIDKVTLQKKLEDSAGPKNESGTSNYESPNPYWPNAAEQWSYQFAPRAAQGIADVVNKTLKEQSKELSANQTQIQEAINKLLSQTQSEILERNYSLHIRSQLLWWKEACYSYSIKQCYKGQKNGLLQLILAKDCSSFLPAIYPVCVDYFLKEMHRALLDEEDKKLKISEILKLIKQSQSELQSIFSESTLEEKRLSLFNYVIGFVWNKHKSNQFKNLVGISINSEITLSEFTLWLFHDLQSLKFK